MNHKEFAELDREQRLRTLRFIQDRDGVDSPLYTSLAALHQLALNRDNGVGRHWRAR